MCFICAICDDENMLGGDVTQGQLPTGLGLDPHSTGGPVGQPLGHRFNAVPSDFHSCCAMLLQHSYSPEHCGLTLTSVPFPWRLKVTWILPNKCIFLFSVCPCVVCAMFLEPSMEHFVQTLLMTGVFVLMEFGAAGSLVAKVHD